MLSKSVLDAVFSFFVSVDGSVFSFVTWGNKKLIGYMWDLDATITDVDCETVITDLLSDFWVHRVRRITSNEEVYQLKAEQNIGYMGEGMGIVSKVNQLLSLERKKVFRLERLQLYKIARIIAYNDSLLITAGISYSKKAGWRIVIPSLFKNELLKTAKKFGENWKIKIDNIGDDDASY